MRKFNYFNPKNLEEAFSFLADLKEDEKACLIAGGTDIILELEEKKISPDVVVNLKSIKELDYVKEDGEFLRIGATASFTKISTNELVLKNANALAQAASKVGSTQIRNLGTVGGNVVTGSACGDTVNALVALDAILVIQSSKGRRETTVEEFYKPNPNPQNSGCCYQNLKGLVNDEILTEIVIRKSNQNEFSAFRKLGKRKALAKSIMTVGMRIEFENDGSVKNSIIALGAVGKHPYSVESAQKIIQGRVLTEDVIEECLNEISNVVFEKIKSRASCPFKKESVKGISREVIENILKRKECKEAK